MASTEEILSDVENLISRNRPNEADDMLRSLIEAMGPEEIQIWDYDLKQIIAKFLPKRKRDLIEYFNKQLRSKTATIRRETPAEKDKTVEKEQDTDITGIKNKFEEALDDLSKYHIFQWATFYRDYLSNFFTEYCNFASLDTKFIKEALTKHSKEIFAKGYDYVSPVAVEQKAITISLSGLQKFLELPIEFYSAKLSSYPKPEASRQLRKICSAFIAGILTGYSETKFGGLYGWQILPRFPRSWSHYLPFLTFADASSFLDNIESGEFKVGATESVCPVINAIDTICGKAIDYVTLPALGQLFWDSRRLEISLRPPPDADDPQLIVIQIYLNPSFISLPILQEAVSRGINAVIAPFRPDLLDQIFKNYALSKIAILTNVDTLKNTVQLLDNVIFLRRSKRQKSAPLPYNYAREFPLHNAFLTKYFHVYRSSVRDLLRTFERRNGVRLWCSVRRSGKTTACFNLATTTGTSVIVSQTCDSTNQYLDSNIFYDEVVDAISAGTAISRTFFSDCIKRIATERRDGTDRYVFVLDEYETLFNLLKSTAYRDSHLRYLIVQPLLNQMVQFTRDNLIVFMGQQPNAHFILMDQNQLSAYVEQDSFPLFYHADDVHKGEFSELLSKVLTERIRFDVSFANSVYKETSGHPYLTVKILVSLVDWLIERKRPSSDMVLSQDDFELFSKESLTTAKISLSREYELFHGGIKEILGKYGKDQYPWLYSVYRVLRDISISSPRSLSCPRNEFRSLVENAGIGELGFSADELLRTGAQANFFDFDDKHVRPKIRILGRIAGACPIKC